MATVEDIKKDIQDWYNEPEEPLLTAFTAFIKQLCFRRSEVTLPSGIAKLFGIEETQVIFWVGEELFAVHKDRDVLKDDGTVVIADWQVDDLYHVEPVQKTVVEFEKVDDLPSAH